ncbi:MAG: aminotransferase class III [Nitrospirae bacterium GWC2_56_14]|nr:MAG: aminotransferase class III [Nitrospirae bacterium GWC2_56_14]
MGKSQDLYKKAKTLIPGGTQLLSKRPEMFLPELWPSYYEKAKGCEVWDLDGNKYIDMITMGIGACILGYADDDVNNAVKAIIDKGGMSILNAPEEVELAEVLCSLHPWAGMVRYTRGGGEAMTVAVRIARARTKKDKVLFCGYHGWHDWYLSANLAEDNALDGHLLPGLAPRGVPRALQGSAYPFAYNDTKGFRELVEKYRNDIGVIVLEAIRNTEPEKDFINAIRDASRELGIVFVVDEITSGWRMNLGGAHLLYGMEPDIAVFAKAISNGFPMGAVIGKTAVMEAAQETFVSSTYWTERIGPTAALATIKKMRDKNVSQHLVDTGKKIQDGWKAAAEKNGLPVEISGIYPLGHFSFTDKEPLVLKTLFTQLMLEKGYLASTAFYASYAHKEDHVDGYLKAVEATFSFLAQEIKKGNPGKHLKGPVCHSGFKRLT